MSLTRFMGWSAALLFVLAAVTWFVLPADRPPALAALLTNFVLTTVAYSVVAKGLEKRPMQFTGYVMGGMMIKMMAGITVILVMGLKFKTLLLAFALTFIISYFAFTAFEVYSLIRKLRRLSKTG